MGVVWDDGGRGTHLVVCVPCDTVGIRLLKEKLLRGNVIDQQRAGLIHNSQLGAAGGREGGRESWTAVAGWAPLTLR